MLLTLPLVVLGYESTGSYYAPGYGYATARASFTQETTDEPTDGVGAADATDAYGFASLAAELTYAFATPATGEYESSAGSTAG